MTDRYKDWLERQAESARQRVSRAPPLDIGAVDDTHSYPIRIAVAGAGERMLLTRIPDTWVERQDEKRVMRALMDALRHHLELPDSKPRDSQ